MYIMALRIQQFTATLTTKAGLAWLASIRLTTTLVAVRILRILHSDAVCWSQTDRLRQILTILARQVWSMRTRKSNWSLMPQASILATICVTRTRIGLSQLQQSRILITMPRWCLRNSVARSAITIDRMQPMPKTQPQTNTSREWMLLRPSKTSQQGARIKRHQPRICTTKQRHKQGRSIYPTWLDWSSQAIWGLRTRRRCLVPTTTFTWNESSTKIPPIE